MGTTLYQLELDHRNINCGMSYVFHLQDGRFFILDGGYFTPGEEERLYAFLRARSNGAAPVIAAWFFSHAHQDHVGCFINFMHSYRSQVTLQRLIYNFQPVDFSGIDGDWKSSDPATVKEFYRTVEQCCAAVPILTPRTGDVFEVGEITIEVLYTQEDLYPKQASFNDYSTVIMTEAYGQKILWLGDIYKKASRILLRKKKDRLACDIVQIAHHGYNGATKALYAATGAQTALWPTPDYFMPAAAKDNRVNAFLLNKMSIQEHLVSGHGTAALALPYHAGSAALSPKQF